MSALPKAGSFDSLTVNEREVGGPDRRTVMLPSSTFGVAPSPPFEGAPPPYITTTTNRTSSELAGTVGSMGAAGAVLPARLSSGSQGAQAGMLSAQSAQGAQASVEGGRRSHGESLSATDNSFGPQSLQSPQSPQSLQPLDTRPSQQRSVSQLPQMTSSSSLGNLAGGTTPITDFPWYC